MNFRRETPVNIPTIRNHISCMRDSRSSTSKQNAKMLIFLLYRLLNFLIIPLVCLTSLLYLLVEFQYRKWQRLGLDYDVPTMPFGSLYRFCMGERPIGLVITDIYERFHGKMVGIYLFFQPVLVVRDAEMVRRIVTTDFASFQDRGMYVNEKQPLTANLLTMKVQSWRTVRTKLTPAFSTGQLRAMFETMDKVAYNFMEHVAEQLKNGKAHTLDMRSSVTTYAIDIIGSIIFGLDINSFTHPNNEFRAISDQVVHTSNVVQKLWSVMNFVCAPVIQVLSFMGLNDPAAYRMREIINRLIALRQKNKVSRRDLLHLMLEMGNADDKRCLGDVLASNSLLFYTAGSESIISITSYLIYELTLNPEIYKRAQAEVDQCLQKHDLKPSECLTYEALEDMQFLDLCIKETLRKYPGLPFLNRVCTQDYRVPDTDFTIKKGTAVILPIFGIHRDPVYFPNPMDFKPQRFTAEHLEYDRVAYMPFGEGPRHCIAQRMGVLSVKVALVKLLANFHIKALPCSKEVEFKFFMMPVLIPKDGIKVTVSKRW